MCKYLFCKLFFFKSSFSSYHILVTFKPREVITTVIIVKCCTQFYSFTGSGINNAIEANGLYPIFEMGQRQGQIISLVREIICPWTEGFVAGTQQNPFTTLLVTMVKFH